MQSRAASTSDESPPRVRAAGRRAAARSSSAWPWLRAWLLALAVLVAVPLPAQAAGPTLNSFVLTRNDDGLFLDYAIDFELPRGAEEALTKSVPLYFVAEASVYRDRWYWRDKRIASATRTWRIVWQPLTQSWRVTLGGLSQSYPTRELAFAAIRRGASWKLADASQIEDGERHYVEFAFRLDTSLLPRPMQIGIGNNGADWALTVERTQRFE